ncbi:hypothetical protein LCGC14_0395380 [marine sediment metagenome]|uniref:Uncharacterized protein n=1 Tax=marine sediment metagenome TaxID=412755 RepID=A0A0F9W7F6_9ZZZZ
MINRCRLSIELPYQLHNKLNDLLEGWRIKNRLYKALTVEIVEIMDKMTSHQRRVFIVAIIESKIKLSEWSDTVKEGMNDAKV